MSIVRAVVTVSAVAVVLALPAAAVQSPDPRTKPETVVAEGIRLLEAKEYVTFLKVLVPPDDFKRLTGQTSVEQVAEAFAESEKAVLLLTVLKSVRDATPTFNPEGTTATYKLKEPALGARDTLVFIKVGEFWYLQS
jgi:hypothetical protein